MRRRHFIYNPAEARLKLNLESPIDHARCREMVSNGARSMSFHQCQRRCVVYEKVEGYRDKLGFCKQHSMAAQEQRRQARDDRFAKESYARDRGYLYDALQAAAYDAVLKLTERQAIAAGKRAHKLWKRIRAFQKDEP